MRTARVQEREREREKKSSEKQGGGCSVDREPWGLSLQKY
jgi:hypothetical protein